MISHRGEVAANDRGLFVDATETLAAHVDRWDTRFWSRYDLYPHPIVNVASPSSVINTGNKWNSFDITARGSRFTIVLNGRAVVDNAEDSKGPRGAVGWQYGAGTVRFRNLRIRPL